MSTFSGPELAGRVANAVLADKPLRVKAVRCACGGEIVADAANPGDEVRRHNRTVTHRIWWIRNEADWQGDE